MYKVFNNSQKIVIDRSDTELDFEDAVVICIRDLTRLPEIVDSHVFGNNELDLVLLSATPHKLQKAFEDLFAVRVAAGGWVFDEKDRLLMIKRDGFWDIPKGHREAEESYEDCALREVEEETGVKALRINSKIGISRHIYNEKGKDILKVTHWYLMKTDYTGELIPQKSEGITKVRWVNKSSVNKKLGNGWRSLLDFWDTNVKHFI